MKLNWETVRQAPTGWKVQDVNGDWHDMRAIMGYLGPGHLVADLAEENWRLWDALKTISARLRESDHVGACSAAEAILSDRMARVRTQPYVQARSDLIAALGTTARGEQPT